MNYKLHTIKKIKETYAILNCIVGVPVLKELQLNNTKRQIARERDTEKDSDYYSPQPPLRHTKTVF